MYCVDSVVNQLELIFQVTREVNFGKHCFSHVTDLTAHMIKDLITSMLSTFQAVKTNDVMRKVLLDDFHNFIINEILILCK